MENTLLLGFKNSEAVAVAIGAYSEIKKQFRALRDSGNPEKFDRIAIWKKLQGEVSKFDFLKAARKAQIAKLNKEFEPVAYTPDPQDEQEVAPDDYSDLIQIASGDGRKPEVKEARKTLDELGIKY